MRFARPLAAVAAVSITLAALPVATFAVADDKAGRFSMTPAEGGALKLDTSNGATWFCTREGGDWSCKPTKDGEQILRKEIEGLKAEILVLKEQLTKMEEIAGIGDPAKGEHGRPGSKMDLPSEEDVDQAFDYVERMVKKLRERINKIESENGKKGAPL